MIDKKAFVFDLDGTLLNSNKEIFPENIKAINDAIIAGHYVAIVTGRNFSQIQPYLEPLKQVQYFVVLNGGAIYDNFSKELKFLSQPLDKMLINDVVSTAQSIKREIQFSNYDRLYRVYFGNNIREDITEEGFFKDATKNPKYDNWEEVKHLLDGPIIRIAIRCEKLYRKDILKELQTKYEGTDICHITESSNAYVECDPVGVSKYNTLRMIVLKHWDDLPMDNIYGFGDTENDLSVLSHLKNSVAMGNASSHIKSVCRHIIGDNNTPAIAEFMNTIIRGDK